MIKIALQDLQLRIYCMSYPVFFSFSTNHGIETAETLGYFLLFGGGKETDKKKFFGRFYKKIKNSIYFDNHYFHLT